MKTSAVRQLRIFSSVFVVSLVAKALNGLVEFGLGVSLLITSSAQVQKLANILTAHELQEDPADVIAGIVIRAGDSIGASHEFVAVYLLVHGIIKLCLAYFLLKRVISFYPWAITVLMAFTLYQTYIVVQSFSFFTLFLTILDAIIVWLAVVEYKRLRVIVDDVGS